MQEPISIYLERSSRSLSDCAELLARIEDGIAPLMARRPDLPVADGAVQSAVRSHAAALQGIDLLSQRLQDLARWLEGLAGAAQRNPPWLVDASGPLAQLHLAELRQRLQGRAPAEVAQSDPLLF
jgi:hypothetical protein